MSCPGHPRDNSRDIGNIGWESILWFTGFREPEPEISPESASSPGVLGTSTGIASPQGRHLSLPGCQGRHEDNTGVSGEKSGYAGCCCLLLDGGWGSLVWERCGAENSGREAGGSAPMGLELHLQRTWPHSLFPPRLKLSQSSLLI